jgi:hypothetical protein
MNWGIIREQDLYDFVRKKEKENVKKNIWKNLKSSDFSLIIQVQR